MAQSSYASQTATLCNDNKNNEDLQDPPNDSCYEYTDVADCNWNDDCNEMYNIEYDEFDHDDQNIAFGIANKYDTIELVDSDNSLNSNDDEVAEVDVHENNNNIELDDPIEVEPLMNDISSKILLEYQQFVEDKTTTTCPLSNNMIAGIELLSLLRASGCSLMLYEKIIG